MSIKFLPFQMLQFAGQTSTMRLLIITVCLFPLAYLFELFSSVALGRSRFLFNLFEALGFIWGWTVLFALVAFLVIGPFRPHSEFSIRGDCGQRALIFFIALAALFTIWFITVISIVVALRGGFIGGP